MPSILVRNLSPETVESLKAAAKAHRRSLQAEAAVILEEAAAARRSRAESLDEFIERVRAATRGIPQTDSAELIREDRDSDQGRG